MTKAFKNANIRNQLFFYNQEMTTDFKALVFTPEAAKLMYLRGTRMRNSYTKQVLSFHLGTYDFPETHSISGRYSMPLWTIATPQLFADIGSETFRQENFNDLKYHASTASQQALEQAFLIDYLHKIRKSIAKYTVFGLSFWHTYDYELLLENNNSYGLDSYGRYPTGGRSYGEFNSETILTRIYFEEAEIGFFKEILLGRLDDLITKDLQHRAGKSDEVLKTLRLELCNLLATEIILSKLILFINTYALSPKTSSLQSTQSFTKEELQLLLEKCLVMDKEALQSILSKGKTSNILERYPLYLSANKYVLSAEEKGYGMVGDIPSSNTASDTLTENQQPIGAMALAQPKTQEAQTVFVKPKAKASTCGFFTKAAMVTTVGLTLYAVGMSLTC